MESSAWNNTMESVSWGFVNEVTNIESFFGLGESFFALGKETCPWTVKGCLIIWQKLIFEHTNAFLDGLAFGRLRTPPQNWCTRAGGQQLVVITVAHGHAAHSAVLPHCGVGHFVFGQTWVLHLRGR